MKWRPAQVYVYLIERVSQPPKKEKEGGRENAAMGADGGRRRERGRMRTTNKGRGPNSRRNYDAKRASKRESNGERERERRGARGKGEDG